MQHGYWDNTRACSRRRRRRFGRRRTCLKKSRGMRRDRLKRITRKYWWRVLDNEERERMRANLHTEPLLCRAPFAYPASPGLRIGSQFVRVWPLYPDRCFRLPFYKNGTSSSLASICNDIRTDTQALFILANDLKLFFAILSSLHRHHRRRREEITAATSTVAAM
jgi:hypothetical protein